MSESPGNEAGLWVLSDLGFTPVIAEELGQMCVAWSCLEWRLFCLFARLSDMPVALARASFYSHRSTRNRTDLIFSTAAMVLRGSQKREAAFKAWLARGEACANRLKTLAADDVEVKEVSCIGRCDRAPAGLFNDRPVELNDEAKVAAWVKQPEAIEQITFPSPQKWVCDPYTSPAEWYSTVLSHPDPDRASTGAPRR